MLNDKLIKKVHMRMEMGPMYIKDGRSYPTSEALAQADEAWKRENLRYIGRDGKFYPTIEELDAANRRYLERYEQRKFIEQKNKEK